jgi:hypothetical protein
MTNNHGWIKLHRSIMEHPYWLAEPFTRAQAWVDLLLLANHKEGHVRKRGILVVIERGCLAWSERALAERWRWSRDKVRRFLNELKKANQIARKVSQKTIPKNASVNALIYIVNYDSFQLGNTENDTEDDTMNKNNKKNKKTPAEILSSISVLKLRYPDQEIIDRTLEAIANTRRTGKIADNVTLSILKAWERYPVEKVMTGVTTYLEKDYAGEGKGERYLLGIIRNSDATAPDSQRMKSTGSKALDDYYKNQGVFIT